MPSSALAIAFIRAMRDFPAIWAVSATGINVNASICNMHRYVADTILGNSFD